MKGYGDCNFCYVWEEQKLKNVILHTLLDVIFRILKEDRE